MSVLFWKQTEDQVKERVEREMKFREKTMNSLLEKIDKENDPVALHEAVSILNSLSAQKEYQELVHATVVNLRKILWPTQQDPTLYETPVKNYPKALQDLLTLGLNKFEKAQDNQAQASS